MKEFAAGLMKLSEDSLGRDRAARDASGVGIPIAVDTVAFDQRFHNRRIQDDPDFTERNLPERRYRERRRPIASPGWADEDLDIKRRLALTERHCIRRALERTKGNRRLAAKLLGVSLRTLFYKLQSSERAGAE